MQKINTFSLEFRNTYMCLCARAQECRNVKTFRHSCKTKKFSLHRIFDHQFILWQVWVRTFKNFSHTHTRGNLYVIYMQMTYIFPCISIYISCVCIFKNAERIRTFICVRTNCFCLCTSDENTFAIFDVSYLSQDVNIQLFH